MSHLCDKQTSTVYGHLFCQTEGCFQYWSSNFWGLNLFIFSCSLRIGWSKWPVCPLTIQNFRNMLLLKIQFSFASWFILGEEVCFPSYRCLEYNRHVLNHEVDFDFLAVSAERKCHLRGVFFSCLHALFRVSFGCFLFGPLVFFELLDSCSKFKEQ